MIGINAKIPKINKNKIGIMASEMIHKISLDALENVQIYGEGASGGFQEPYGGAPHWLGSVTVPGHYSGYLSETHYIKRVSPTHAQIISPSGFAYGVIMGQSTNWITRDGGYYTFRPNPYHKRAVDKLFTDSKFGLHWKTVMKSGLR